MKNKLQKQVVKKDFWKVSNDVLENIGYLYDDLSHIVFMGS